MLKSPLWRRRMIFISVFNEVPCGKHTGRDAGRHGGIIAQFPPTNQ